MSSQDVAMLVSLGCPADRAVFFLEASGGDIDAAAAAFLEAGEAGSSAPPSPARPDGPYQAHATGPYNPTGGPTSTTSSSSTTRPGGRPALRGGFATLGSLGARDDDGDDDDDDGHGHGDDDDDDDEQDYYAGSGQMIKGPGKADRKPAMPKMPGGDAPGAAAFGGTAYKLGTSATGSTVVPGAGQQQQQQRPGVPAAAKGPAKIELHMWKNGFSIDDGPLRRFDDPANNDFVQSITKGEYPEELRETYGGGELHVAMHDKRGQEYVEPPKKMVPFSGSGFRLGDTPAASSASTAAPSSRGPGPAAAPVAGSGAKVNVDQSQPTTMVQIRYADGSNEKVTFNHSHTVGDVRRYIDAAGKGGFGYNLMTTFPQKALTDNSQTLAAADLLNSVVVQRRL